MDSTNRNQLLHSLNEIEKRFREPDEADELFGDDENPPEDECRIIFDSKLSHAEKVEKVRALRDRKFEDVIETAALYAHALGVLDDSEKGPKPGETAKREIRQRAQAVSKLTTEARISIVSDFITLLQAIPDNIFVPDLRRTLEVLCELTGDSEIECARAAARDWHQVKGTWGVDSARETAKSWLEVSGVTRLERIKEKLEAQVKRSSRSVSGASPRVRARTRVKRAGRRSSGKAA
jgi:hypothetical protein